VSQKSDLKRISIAICFATNQRSVRRSGIQRRPIWPVRLPLVTAMLGLPHERSARAGRALARPLQHHPAPLLARLQITGTRGMADKEHGVWRSGNRYALPTSPHPRRRLLELRNSCVTLTHPTAQKIGHSNPHLPHRLLRRQIHPPRRLPHRRQPPPAPPLRIVQQSRPPPPRRHPLPQPRQRLPHRLPPRQQLARPRNPLPPLTLSLPQLSSYRRLCRSLYTSAAMAFHRTGTSSTIDVFVET
jgi:hypothetical protein